MASVATLRDLTEALIETAEEETKLDKITADLEGFFSIFSTHGGISDILRSSVYSTEERKGIVGDLGEKAGFDKLTVNFIGLAIELGKFTALVKSEQPFMRKVRRASGKATAEIIMARPPSEEDLNRIKEALKGLTQREVEVSVKVDPSIIGGIVAKVEDKVFDGSIKSQLERLRNILSVT